jgi:small subunit ribosomal protein S16
MVRIRLRRMGLKNQSTYRLVAADKESPRDGRFLEILGFYNPRTNPTTLEVKEDRIYEWMQKGAQPTESVLKLFNSINLMDRFSRLKAGEPLDKILEDAKINGKPKATELKKKQPKTTPKTETKPAESKTEKPKAEAKPAEEQKVTEEVKTAEEPKASEEVKPTE